MIKGKTSWTDEEMAMLRKLVGQGYSGTQIGVLMDRTRNSIIGRCGRTGLQLGSTNKALPTARSIARRKRLNDIESKQIQPSDKTANVSGSYRDPPAPEYALGVTWDELESHHCRYIYGENEDKAYCGQPRAMGLSYCKECATLTQRDPVPADKYHGKFARHG